MTPEIQTDTLPVWPVQPPTVLSNNGQCDSQDDHHHCHDQKCRIAASLPLRLRQMAPQQLVVASIRLEDDIE